LPGNRCAGAIGFVWSRGSLLIDVASVTVVDDLSQAINGFCRAINAFGSSATMCASFEQLNLSAREPFVFHLAAFLRTRTASTIRLEDLRTNGLRHAYRPALGGSEWCPSGCLCFADARSRWATERKVLFMRTFP